MRRNPHFLIDNRTPNPAMTADINAVEQDRILHHGVTIDTHVGRKNASPHMAAADDAALADHAVMGFAAAGGLAPALPPQNKLRRRHLLLHRLNRHFTAR